ncbi:MAG: carbamoyl-phosphate synthase small subunit [Cytophagales bacterium]|nr:MAG: carbamoyl-phosphate synthase small subunit [Cytophagales bacterium]TAF59308.1 MAG: carbamoyl-phosphate synthase small subunit [Cytophagales bacterium]
MTYNKQKAAAILLADGTYIQGFGIGQEGTTGGEICFNTGMTGYQEIYTDPSYYGQIVVNTTSHIGNYGALDTEQESVAPKIKGLVVRNFSDIYSRKTAQGSLRNFLVDSGIIGISNVDTRALVRHISQTGAMNAVISSENTDLDFLRAKLAQVPNMDGLELSSFVTTSQPYEMGNPNATLRIAVLDLGVKQSILHNLVSRGCFLKVFPSWSTYQDLKSWKPNGYFISNGPGDPSVMSSAISLVKTVLSHSEPIFGICLGHQILALATGLETYKMHHGHRGLNHPVKNIEQNRCEVTSQNHGFAVVREGVERSQSVRITHVNLNDHTVAGIRVVGKPAFSVQYHPESSPGPHDSRYLFDDFVEMVKKYV